MLEDRQDAMAEVAADQPPESVLDAVSAAGELYELLEAADIRLHFRLHAEWPRVSVELQDGAGDVLSAITPAQALELAASAARHSGPKAASSSSASRTTWRGPRLLASGSDRI